METKKSASEAFAMQCSYPTYEEWKLTAKVSLMLNHLFVLILPMRNGNLRLFRGLFIFFIVLILPMRNGNQTFACLLSTCLAKFLSYLWGMETLLNWHYTTFISHCSYPTYEEWKLDVLDDIIERKKKVLILPMRNGNLRTGTKKRMKHKMVLILPMRNGNFFEKGGDIPQPLFVLILPMRNGNSFLHTCTDFSIFVLILPMRNGNL